MTVNMSSRELRVLSDTGVISGGTEKCLLQPTDVVEAHVGRKKTRSTATTQKPNPNESRRQHSNQRRNLAAAARSGRTSANNISERSSSVSLAPDSPGSSRRLPRRTPPHGEQDSRRNIDEHYHYEQLIKIIILIVLLSPYAHHQKYVLKLCPRVTPSMTAKDEPTMS